MKLEATAFVKIVRESVGSPRLYRDGADWPIVYVHPKASKLPSTNILGRSRHLPIPFQLDDSVQTTQRTTQVTPSPHLLFGNLSFVVRLLFVRITKMKNERNVGMELLV